MKKIIFLSGLIVFSFISCNKILDTTPRDFVSPSNFYKTEKDLQSALAGIYDRLGDLRVYGQAMPTYLAFSDEFFMKGRTTGILGNVMDASTLELNRHWESLYTGIERANLLLDNLPHAEVSQEVLDDVKGQALFLRAYYYFLLVEEFGDVPLKLSSTKSPDEQPLNRSKVKDVYDQIVADMKTAAGLVKSISEFDYNTRVTKTAVQGILARVYLTMAGFPLKDDTKYKDARLYADSVIQSGLHALNPDYQQIFVNHSKEIFDTKECLWEVEFRGNNQGEIQEGGMIGIYNGISCRDIDTGFGYDYVHATAKLYNAYQAGDLRRDWSIAPFQYVTSGATVVRSPWTASQIYERGCGKWRRADEAMPRNQNYNGTNWPLIRYADVLLMFAEADNQVNNGPTQQGYDALNKVRRRGYGQDIQAVNDSIDAPAGMTKQDFQDFIENERLRELDFEGLRKYDLIRWGIYLSVMRTQSQVYQSTMPSALKQAAVFQADHITERAVLFPIPNSEMANNPAMKQNAGW